MDGFLLLQEGELPPADVRYPRLSAGPGISRSFDSASELAERTTFPVYALETLPIGHRSGRATLQLRRNGEIRAASVAYQSFDEDIGAWVNTVSVSMRRGIPTPFPLWPARDSSVDPLSSVHPERASFLPKPGFRTSHRRGHTYLWIESATLYAFKVANGGSASEADGIAAGLRVVKAGAPAEPNPTGTSDVDPFQPTDDH